MWKNNVRNFIRQAGSGFGLPRGIYPHFAEKNRPKTLVFSVMV